VLVSLMVWNELWMCSALFDESCCGLSVEIKGGHYTLVKYKLGERTYLSYQATKALDTRRCPPGVGCCRLLFSSPSCAKV